MAAILFILDALLTLVVVAFLLRALMPLVRADFRNPLGQAVLRFTDPLVRPLRRVIGPVGRVDTASIVALLLVQFAGRHPGVRLNLAVHNREDLLVQLADNLTDLAVMVRPPQDADTVSEPFAPHPYVIVAPPGHALARERGITLAQVVREPFIVREKGSDTWQSMADGLGRQLERLNVAMEIRSTETIKQAVLAGMGISFLSAHTVSRELRDKSLVTLDVQGFPLMLNWYLVQRRQKRLPPVARAFREFLLAEGARLIREVDPLPTPKAHRAKPKVRVPSR